MSSASLKQAYFYLECVSSVSSVVVQEVNSSLDSVQKMKYGKSGKKVNYGL